MTDLRLLLSRAADEVGVVTPPVDLLVRARRRQRNLVGSAAMGAVLVALVALVVAGGLLPAAQRAGKHPVPGASMSVSPAVPPTATAAALRGATWRTGAASPIGAGLTTVLTWSGGEVLQVGGRTGQDAQRAAAYDPQSDTWRTLPPLPATLGSTGGPQLWLGDRLLVIPSLLGAGPSPTTPVPARGAIYQPGRNTWTSTSPDPLGALRSTAAVTVGNRVLVVGIDHDALRAVWYDPRSDQWSLTDPPPMVGHAPYAVSLVSTPAGVLLWSQWAHLPPASHRDSTFGVDVLRLTSRWTDATGAWPQFSTVVSPQLADGQVLFSSRGLQCPSCLGGLTLGRPARLADPQTLHTTALPAGPLDAANPTLTWTGAAILAVDTAGAVTDGARTLNTGDTAVLDPASQQWSDIAKAPASIIAAYNIPPLWAGDRLLVLTPNGQPVTLH